MIRSSIAKITPAGSGSEIGGLNTDRSGQYEKAHNGMSRKDWREERESDGPGGNCEANSPYLSNAANTSRISILLAVNVYGPGATHFFMHTG